MANFLKKLHDLRRLLKEMRGDVIIIPHCDQFQGEYINNRDARLEWLTGFTGSAGLAIVSHNKAALFVDGRYTLQAQQQVNHFSIHDFKDTDIKNWLQENLTQNAKVVIDPWLITASKWERWGITLTPSQDNLIDKLWDDRPIKKLSEITLHEVTYAGEEAISKINRLQTFLKEKELDSFVLTKPENICWLLNIRGNDIPFTPLVNCFAVITIDHIHLFVDSNTVNIKGLNLVWHNIDDFLPFVQNLRGKSGIDHTQIPKIVFEAIPSSNRVLVDNPCIKWEAKKNITEQNGAKEAHLYDGIAVCEFLAWLDLNWKNLGLNEYTAAEHLLRFRQIQPLFQQPSFATISSMGPNGAIIHYQPQKDTALPLTDGIYLLDSGGQYLCGTTDITRVILLGNQACKEESENYTRVLKGHIALSSIIFPYNTTGGQLDVLARQFLWQKGLDYAHGTGHGVGSYLAVHEGPQRIGSGSNIPLMEGMILSNEPGYYKDGFYGIRLENLILTQKYQEFEHMLCFHNLTLVPFERKLIAKHLLTQQEIYWINNYHQEIKEKITPHLGKEAKAWLLKNTQVI